VSAHRPAASVGLQSRRETSADYEPSGKRRSCQSDDNDVSVIVKSPLNLLCDIRKSCVFFRERLYRVANHPALKRRPFGPQIALHSAGRNKDQRRMAMFRLDYLSCLLTVVATVLVGRKMWTGLVVSGLNSFIVCVIGLHTSQYGFIPANVFCICINAFNLRAWLKVQKEPSESTLDKQRTAHKL
jgi:hypothetical protein